MKHEPEHTRVRQGGRVVTRAKTPQERIDAIRAIVTTGSYAKVDGLMVDHFSASAITQVFDALNPENQAKYSALSVRRMADVAFKLINRRAA
jgi:hypothetical protein